MPDINDMTIPEMAAVKAKYPEYQDMPDVGLLNTIVRKFPVYKPIADRVAGEILDKRREDGIVSKRTTDEAKIKDLSNQATALSLGLEGTEDYIYGFGNIPLGAVVKRAYGATQALVAGKDPIEGFKNPTTQPSFGESAVAAYGLDLNNPTHLGAAALIDSLSNFGTGHLLFGVPSKAIAGAKAAYSSAQSASIDKLKGVLVNELKAAGVGPAVAENEVNMTIAKQFQGNGPLQNNPVSIAQTTAILQSNKGKLADIITGLKISAEKTAADKGYGPDFFKGAQKEIASQIQKPRIITAPFDITPDPTPILPVSEGRAATAQAISSKIEVTPQPSQVQLELFQKLGGENQKEQPNTTNTTVTQQTQPDTAVGRPTGTKQDAAGAARSLQTNESPIAKLDVHPITQVSIPPVQPQELQASPNIADEVLQRPANQDPGVRAQAQEIQKRPSPEIVKPTPETPPIPMTAKDRRAAVAKKYLEDYSSKTFYDITYKDTAGVHTTIGDGIKLKMLEDKGQVLKKERWNEKGELNLGPLFNSVDDLATNTVGTGQEISSDLKRVFKQLGTPFFIGEKYPSFKPIIGAINDASAKKQEIFNIASRKLNSKSLLNLPPSSSRKISNAIELGNSKGIQKYYTPQELVEKFQMNPEEIKAYGNIVDTYNFNSQVEIANRKIYMGFDKLTPEQQAQASQTIEQQVKALGGYVSTSRLEGKWAVYQAPLEGTDETRHFSLHANKADAEKVASKLGEGSRVYLRNNIDKELYRKLSVADLEALAEAADVDTKSSDVQALIDELRKRTFSSRWIRRDWVPGYEFNLRNIVDSALDYSEGVSNRHARVIGRKGAEQAFAENGHKMDAGLKEYTRRFLDLHYTSGSIGFKALDKALYISKLSFKVGWLATNLTQPIATTLPAMTEHMNMAQAGGMFLRSYADAVAYTKYKLGGKSTLNPQLTGILSKLQRQGVLGDQLTKFQLASSHLSSSAFDSIIGSFGRAGEWTNRVHAAITGIRIATETLGFKDRDQILEFTRNFVTKTQFAYGKANLPTMITGAGNIRDILKTMYTFKGYQVNYLQFLAGAMPWRGAKMSTTMTALGGLLAQAGIKGAPFFALIGMAYLAFTGRTLDNDMREAMQEAGIPDKAIDLSLHGIYSPMGIDGSQMVGMGDIVSPYGDLLQKIGGAPVGLANQIGKGVYWLEQGDTRKAMQYLSPDFIGNLLKAKNSLDDGVRKFSGELVFKPSQKDAFLQSLGFSSLNVNKAYEAMGAKQQMKTKVDILTSDINRKLAESISRKDRATTQRLLQEVRGHNATAPLEERIILSADAIRGAILRRRGIQKGQERKLIRANRRIDQRYHVTR